MQVNDTSAIHRLIDRARRRIRAQWALEGATTATILAAAAALVVMFLMRIDAVGRGTGIALLIATLGIIAAGALVKALRPLDDEGIARRIDRASGLADRLSTAIAFAREATTTDDDTHAMMQAAIRDGVAAVPRANVERATPFTAPVDLRAAAIFVVLSALAAGLAVPARDATQALVVPVPAVDPVEVERQKALAVALDPDDKAYLESLLAELKATAKRDQVPELEEFTKKIEQLLKDASMGKVSKEKLLEELAKAEAQLNQNPEPNQAELDQQLAELGKQMSKEQITKPLGDALQKQDLEKAKQELEKLADKLDQKQLSDKDKEQLAKQLDQASKQLDQKEQKDQQKQQQQKQKTEDEIRRLEKKKQDAKTPEDKLDAERQLQKKKDELKKLDKDEQDKQDSAQRQALKRLTRDMEKAAEGLQKPQKDDKKDDKKDGDKQDGDKQDQQRGEKQASQKLKDAARETGRVDRDRRKQATQKKMSSQMDDLREAMRRAKQKGNKNNDPFGKQGKNRDFAQRARGQRGQGGAWKPGQGQGQGGQGQGQNGPGQNGQGQNGGGSEWGTEHDDNLVGDPTQKSGNTRDADLQGKQGTSGGGTRETILSAAQKGFASASYKQVYGKYQQVIEEVMRTEKLPPSYKYYVKKYFAKIRPSTEAPATEDKP